ncbi:MAG: hypothetical protein K1X94_24220 [Sandaracinaceae bacterium]|nr:hypothetical protein [Sandaracinaceae bacterium]
MNVARSSMLGSSVALVLALGACDSPALRGSDGGARDAIATFDARGNDAAPGDGGRALDAYLDPTIDAYLDPSLDAFVVPGDDAFVALPDAFVPPGIDAFVLPPDAFVPPPDAFVPPPPTGFETLFSHRSATNDRDTTIEDRVVQLIDMAVPGSRIRVAIYTFTRGAPSAALVRAAMRGVDVRIVLDGGADATVGSEVATLRTGLGAGNVHLCDAPGTSCIGTGIMHHKTFLFSELSDGSRNVVMQSSHNLTTTQLTMHNNAVIVRGDAALFAAYEHTWNDLWADVENADYYRIDDGDLATRLYSYPRGTGGDTSVSILDNVTCDGTARIRVAMAFFTNARSAVADALAARAREGCDVRVVAGDAEIPLGTTVASTLTGAGVRLTRYPERTNGWSLHSKYIVIDARYSGSATHRRLVFTGSHNWTGPSLTDNDETQLRIEDDAVFDAYMADWAHIQASASLP